MLIASSYSILLSFCYLASVLFDYGVGEFPVENDSLDDINDYFIVANVSDKVDTLELERRVINGVEANANSWKFLVAILRTNPYGNLVSVTTTVNSNNKINVYNSLSLLLGKPIKGGRRPLQTSTQQQHYSQSCGGTLVAANFILTAGHCVVDDNNKLLSPSAMLARIGAHELSANSNPNIDDVEIEKIYLRDGFNVNQLEKGGDLALLKLKRPVKTSPTIKSAPLPPSGLKYSVGTECFSAGWGVTETGKSSDIPLEVDVPIYNLNSCAKTWSLPKASMDGRIICAIAPDWSEDTCYGDSGGPLVCKLPANDKTAAQKNVAGKWVLSGIVSYGSSKCAQRGVPGMYTSISYHMSWITKIITGTTYE